jgi:ribosome-associated toxin RatA of RatAB toxin-antitoxin module
MREVKRSALVNKPPAVVFALINDIESYPQFVPWCTHAQVIERTPEHIIATLGVRQGPLHGEFTTRNTLEPEQRVRMQLLRGPFRSLSGEWRLTPLGATGCQVELSVRFAFNNPLTAFVLERTFAQTLGSLVDAFVARARTVP